MDFDIKITVTKKNMDSQRKNMYTNITMENILTLLQMKTFFKKE